MTLSVAIAHFALLILITVNSCNGKNQYNEKSDAIPKKDNSDGIVYFSFDNGSTWENKSTGLPSTTNIGLGGIAISEKKLALISKDSGLYFFNFPEQRWFNIPTDNQIIESNPGSLFFFKDNNYVGTQSGGKFQTTNEGKSWAKLNIGFNNLTIRKLAEIENKLYAATNSGLYFYNDLSPDRSIEQENSNDGH